MPPLPTIAGVVRVTVPFNAANSIAPALVFHFDTTLADEDDIGLAFSTGWQTVRATAEPIYPMADDFIATTLDIIKLDGSSATFTYTLPTVIQGNQGGEYSPASCAVVSMHTAQRGPRGRGRKYVGPIVEGKMTDGSLNVDAVGEMQDAWDLLLGQWNSPAGDLRLGIASYVHSDFHPVTSARVDGVLGTQRRRQDRLR